MLITSLVYNGNHTNTNFSSTELLLSLLPITTYSIIVVGRRIPYRVRVR